MVGSLLRARSLSLSLSPSSPLHSPGTALPSSRGSSRHGSARPVDANAKKSEESGGKSAVSAVTASSTKKGNGALSLGPEGGEVCGQRVCVCVCLWLGAQCVVSC